MGRSRAGRALEREPIGSYLYEKEGQTYHVTVFLMKVTSVAQEWPERSFRQRTWVSPTGFFDRIEEPGLAEIVRLALVHHTEEEIASA